MAARAFFTGAFRPKGGWARTATCAAVALPSFALCAGADKLDIYDPEGPEVEYVYIEEETGPLREAVSAVRQTVWDVTAAVKSAAKSVAETSNELESKIRRGARDIIPAEETVFPGAFIVAAAYMGGVLLAKNRPLAQRILYPVAAAGVASALCYPKHMREGADAIRDTVKRLTNSQNLAPKLPSFASLGKGAEKKPTEVRPSFEEAKAGVAPSTPPSDAPSIEATPAAAPAHVAETVPVAEAVPVHVVDGRNEIVVVDDAHVSRLSSPDGEDRGQSREDDEHMYTTRK